MTAPTTPQAAAPSYTCPGCGSHEIDENRCRECGGKGEYREHERNGDFVRDEVFECDTCLGGGALFECLDCGNLYVRSDFKDAEKEDGNA